MIATYLHWQAAACRDLGSPFYGVLVDGLADDAAAGGPIGRVLGDFDRDPKEAALALRLLGTVHRMVLSGEAPRLAAHYPSVGGDGDAAAAVSEFTILVDEHMETIRDGLAHPPQTNEVGRSAPLFGTLLYLAPVLPVRLCEVGASAGLNLVCDELRYLAADGSSWGPETSSLVLANAWDRAPGTSRPVIAERMGIDPSPIDITDAAAVLSLTSYVWPDQTERLERLRSAIAIARRRPIVVEAMGLGEFLTGLHLEEGTLTIVWHSVIWQYLEASEKETAEREFQRLIGESNPDAEFAHISFEPELDHPFPVSYEDRRGIHRIGEAPAHGLPTRWY